MESLFDILAVLIGVVFIYLVLSMLVSYLVELISTFMQKRQSFLADVIQIMLYPSITQLVSMKQITGSIQMGSPKADDMVSRFYCHPAIKSLSKPGALPSYIGPAAFINVLLAELHQQGKLTFINKLQLPDTLKDLTLEQIRDMIPADLKIKTLKDLREISPEDLRKMLPQQLASLEVEDLYKILSTDYVDLLETGLHELSGNSAELRTILQPYFDKARLAQKTTTDRLQTIVGEMTEWYKTSMDRATGWYTRYTKKVSLVVALIVAFALNADTIEIFQSLYTNASLRQMVNSAAVEYVKNYSTDGILQQESAPTTNEGSGSQDLNLEEIISTVNAYESSIPVPLGWSSFINSITQVPQSAGDLVLAWILKLFGLIATTLAISQGSSIWFQLLSKLINLRNSGAKPTDTAPSTTSEKG